MAILDVDLSGHMELLQEKVFQIETKWPHYRLLLDDLLGLSQTLGNGVTVVALERTLLYGGYSLFAPLFSRQNFISIDCSPRSADSRHAYNRGLVDDPRFIPIPTTHHAEETTTGLADNLADIVIVPNLVHHVADQDALFAEMARICKWGGRVYVFEPLIRELHQMPDDYLRYTPFGIARIMERNGMQPQPFRLEGGPFSAIAYCWTEALQYFPENERKEKEEWFYNHHFKELMSMDARCDRNLVRPHTRFAMAFSIEAVKVND